MVTSAYTPRVDGDKGDALKSMGAAAELSTTSLVDDPIGMAASM
jgi:hypothetical protein